MAGSNPNPRLRGGIELTLRIVGPVLNLMLAIGDRVSRVLEPDDPDFMPARMAGSGEAAPRGLTEYPNVAGPGRPLG